MSARDLIQEALYSLEANKGRSLLTILGIVIGIASVIAMTSLIGGIQNSLVNSLGLNAARMVQIYSSQELTDSDIEKLQKLVPQIEQIGIVDSAYTEYKTGDKSYTVMAQGVDSDMLDAVGASKLVAGRTYSQAESQSGSRVALISRNGADQLYGNEQDALGKTIKVSNGEVQIVGVIDGGSDSMGSLTLYMPRETISGLFSDENPSFPSVTALAAEGTDMDELCKTIESKVRAMKGIEEEEEEEYDSVSATSMKSAIDALNSFMGAFSLIMGAVASISLLVGGIGIMNMMLTNVTERIREIGIRRALGASRRDITAQFLAESSALCVTGGILGVVIGYLLAWGLTFFAASSGIMSEFGATGTITPSFSITTVLIAFAVSVGIGVIFGFYPARRAAKLDPVECLRYQ